MEHILAYEFYHHNQEDQRHLIGILPESRKDPQRITPESIMNWVKKLLGNDWNMERIGFIEVTIDKMTGEIVESK
ncbi:MAG: hypothetical protein FJ106_13770 [Deltaproteobacteria bacterium]|nr:hypothetical protein [Deltaproteobacteria bacterium]